MPTHTRATAPIFWASALRNVAVGLSPAVILTAAFLAVIERLGPLTLEGVPITAVLVACAVFVPLLSYLVSAPVFAAINSAHATEHSVQCAITRRALPVIAPWAVGFALVLGLMLSGMLGWPLLVRLALVVNLALHLIMAIVMVAGFATRRPFLLVCTWVAYGLALLALPQAAWWLPPTLATAVHLGWLLVLARGVTAPALPPAKELLRTVPNGFIEGAPIWLLGPALWLLRPDTFQAGVYYPAIVPSLIGYQVFMFAVADPLWHGVSRFQQVLSDTPYAVARAQGRTLTVRVRRAGVLFLIGYPLLIVLGIWAVTAWAFPTPPASNIVIASCANSLLFAFAYLCGIVGRRRPIAVASLTLTAVTIVALLLGLSDALYLTVITIVALLLTAVIAGITFTAWRRPEYTLFWRKAMTL